MNLERRPLKTLEHLQSAVPPLKRLEHLQQSAMPLPPVEGGIAGPRGRRGRRTKKRRRAAESLCKLGKDPLSQFAGRISERRDENKKGEVNN